MSYPSMFALIFNILFAVVAYARNDPLPYYYNDERPLILAHRGASGYFPENSELSFIGAS